MTSYHDPESEQVYYGPVREREERSPHSDAFGMSLPGRYTCDDCMHFRRCWILIGRVADDQICDWSPSRFQLRAPAAEARGDSAELKEQLQAKCEALARLDAAYRLLIGDVEDLRDQYRTTARRQRRDAHCRANSVATEAFRALQVVLDQAKEREE